MKPKRLDKLKRHAPSSMSRRRQNKAVRTSPSLFLSRLVLTLYLGLSPVAWSLQESGPYLNWIQPATVAFLVEDSRVVKVLFSSVCPAFLPTTPRFRPLLVSLRLLGRSVGRSLLVCSLPLTVCSNSFVAGNPSWYAIPKVDNTIPRFGIRIVNGFECNIALGVLCPFPHHKPRPGQGVRWESYMKGKSMVLVFHLPGP
jgi:hypothetical protein